MKIVIGSDKSGYPLRKELEAHLKEAGYELIVYGPKDAEEAVPFYEVAPLAAKEIQNSNAERGILICGTGMGMSQVANKFKGVRAACVENAYSAKMCRIINDSNILCMGGWMIAPTLGIQMVDEFLAARFTVGVEEWRKAWLENAKKEFGKLEDNIYG
ncbi:MAG: RpiB/LacA/LacB family sugar-phosphate isomerase [Eubacterium sp.]|nr:RpiB/LacA/LacB family sugar-phosphate isomerase [Eubacterium sp.]